MNQKTEKPTLSGQRIKTRKRDEKEKNDPTGFRDAILQGFNEAGSDLEQVSKFLDIAGSKLDYRRYGEPLFDILFAGGILAPGGSIVYDGDPGGKGSCGACVFSASDDLEVLRGYAQVFTKLIRRYKYLEKTFQDEVKKILVFLKAFSDSERHKLAQIVGIFLANGQITASVLISLFQDHLVKEGISLDFAVVVFKTWLKEKDANTVTAGLRKANIESRLLELLPQNKRTQEQFEDAFKDAGLESVVEFQKLQQNAGVKKELQVTVADLIRDNAPVKDVISAVQENIKKYVLNEHEVVVLVWNTLMGAMEWNKKEELVAEQALKHLRQYSPVLAALTSKDRSELALIIKVQEYCYDNMNFMKVFQKIVVLFYKSDVLSEDVILKWYKEAHSSKGKSVFLEQTKNFIEWLQSAEEESESGEEED